MWFEVAPQLFHTYVLTPVLDLHSECFSRFTAHLHHDNRHSDTSSHFLLHGNTEGFYCDLQLQYIQIHVHTLEMNYNIDIVLILILYITIHLCVINGDSVCS